MTTSTTYTATYMRRSSSASVLSCGTRFARPIFIRDDGSWEVFDDASLPSYLVQGAHTLKERIDALADPHTPYSVEHIKELRFMLEALIDAKMLLRSQVTLRAPHVETKP